MKRLAGHMYDGKTKDSKAIAKKFQENFFDILKTAAKQASENDRTITPDKEYLEDTCVYHTPNLESAKAGLETVAVRRTAEILFKDAEVSEKLDHDAEQAEKTRYETALALPANKNIKGEIQRLRDEARNVAQKIRKDCPDAMYEVFKLAIYKKAADIMEKDPGEDLAIEEMRKQMTILLSRFCEAAAEYKTAEAVLADAKTKIVPSSEE